MELEELRTASAASSSRLISFDKAEIFYGLNPNIPLLLVSGMAPCQNMDVQLVPRIYARCPEYWGIELVGQLPDDICLEAVEPFGCVLPLTGITGSKGIELIAANGNQTFDVAGGCDADGPR